MADRKMLKHLISLLVFLVILNCENRALMAQLIYSNDFDDDATGTYTVLNLNADWNTPPFDNGVAEGRVSIVDGTQAYSGKSLAVTYPAGLFGSGDNETGAQWKLDFDQGYEEVELEYRVKFGAGFDFVRGGKLPGLIGGAGNVGGNVPDGTDGFSARMMWRTDGSSGSALDPSEANIVQYVYHPDQPATFGEDFRWDDGTSGTWEKFESDTWYHLRHRIVMNTPGLNDGVVQAWLDGEMVLNVNDIRFRDVASLQIDQMYFSTFFGGSTSAWQTSKNEIAYFDDFRITAVPEPSPAATVIFDGEQTPFDPAALTAFDETQDLGDGSNYGVESLDTSAIFGTGLGMRIYDNSTGGKPDLQGELAAPLLGAFRIDFDSNNLGTASSNKAIRFRMANSGLNVGSESRTAFSISWQADGKINGKYSGVVDGNLTDVDTKNSAPLVGPQTTTMVANGAISGDYTYTLFGETRTLHPLHYDLYINGVLLNTGTDPDFANGMQFTLENSSIDYDPALGLQRFGLFGSSSTDVDPDYAFDNIVLRTGTDIEGVVLGDANGDGVVNSFDITAFGLALFQPAMYAAMYPGMDPDVVLDMNNDGVFNSFDIPGFGTALGF